MFLRCLKTQLLSIIHKHQQVSKQFPYSIMPSSSSKLILLTPVASMPAPFSNLRALSISNKKLKINTFRLNENIKLVQCPLWALRSFSILFFACAASITKGGRRSLWQRDSLACRCLLSGVAGAEACQTSASLSCTESPPSSLRILGDLEAPQVHARSTIVAASPLGIVADEHFEWGERAAGGKPIRRAVDLATEST